jgi:hypothetical protein
VFNYFGLIFRNTQLEQSFSDQPNDHSRIELLDFAFGGAPGDVLKDLEGIQTIRTLGENMAWVMTKLG